MKILYVTSEAAPFCKTGGLADVAGSLPPALAANGDEVAVILPLSAVTLGMYFVNGGQITSQGIPYIIGGALGGIGAGILLKKIKSKWLHWLLGAFILYGGFRLICS